MRMLEREHVYYRETQLLYDDMYLAFHLLQQDLL